MQRKYTHIFECMQHLSLHSIHEQTLLTTFQSIGIDKKKEKFYSAMPIFWELIFFKSWVNKKVNEKDISDICNSY